MSPVIVMVPVADSVPSNVTVTVLLPLVRVSSDSVKCVLSQVSTMGPLIYAALTVKTLVKLSESNVRAAGVTVRVASFTTENVVVAVTGVASGRESRPTKETVAVYVPAGSGVNTMLCNMAQAVASK